MTEKTESEKNLGIVFILRFIFTSLLIPGIFYLSSGRLDWWEMWAYIANFLVVVVSGRLFLLLKRPDQARERMEAGKKENVKAWDKRIVPLVGLYLPFASMIIAGLDKRFGWSGDLPDWIQLIALGFLFLGGMLGNWAMIANPFFSSHVRIQTDRGHQVVDRGPYRFVRHPGYASAYISWLAAPVFFSSWWVAVPCVTTLVLYTYRIIMEDRTLQEELPGYRAYAGRVRWRILPGVW